MSAYSWHDKDGHLWLYYQVPGRRYVRKMVFYKGKDAKLYDVSQLNIRRAEEAKPKMLERPDLINCR